MPAANATAQSNIPNPEPECSTRNIQDIFRLVQLASDSKPASEILVDGYAREALAAARYNDNLLPMAVEIDDLCYELTGKRYRVQVGDVVTNASDRKKMVAVRAGMLRFLVQEVRELAEMQKAMRSELAALKIHSDPKVTHARRLAEEALHQAILPGTIQSQDLLKDSIGFMDKVAESPIARQDPFFWLQRAWLIWKVDHNHALAGEAFAKAVATAGEPCPRFNQLVLRHKAYMAYLCDDAEEAYQLALQAGALHYDSLVSFDLARYAGLTGHTEEALAHLERSLRSRPLNYLKSLCEPDFMKIRSAVERLLNDLCEESRENASEKASGWESVVDAVESKGLWAGVQIKIPNSVRQKLEDYLSIASNCDFISSEQIWRESDEKAEETFRMAEEKLQAELFTRAQEIARMGMDLNEKSARAQSLIAQAEDQMNEDIRVASEERSRKARPDALLCSLISTVSAILWTVLSQSANRGLAMFASTLAGSLLVSYGLNAVSAANIYSAKVKVIRENFHRATAEPERWLKESLPAARKRLAELEEQKRRTDEALCQIRQKQLETEDSSEEA